MQTLWIPGPLPGRNELDAMIAAAYWKSGKRHSRYSAAKRGWTETIMLYARQARLKTVRGPVVLHYQWIEPNRRRDLGNIAGADKLVADALVRAGILPDDSQRWVVGLSHTCDIASDDQPAGVYVRLVDAGGPANGGDGHGVDQGRHRAAGAPKGRKARAKARPEA